MSVKTKIKNFFLTLPRHFAKIERADTARLLAKEGAIAGVAIGLMEILGVVAALLGRNPETGDAMTTSELANLLVATLIIIPVTFALTWRVKTGKGFLSAYALFCLFVLEIWGKIENGTASLSWIVLYVLIAFALLNAARACWYLRKQARHAPSADAETKKG